MARIRSPNYPALSLGESIIRVAKLFERERQHPMDKIVAVKGMGYGGVNGSSLTAISALLKYGLLEQIGDAYKVTARAVSILHPHNQAEKDEALQAAAREPALFSELLDHYQGSLPSDDNLRAYLVRRGFSEVSLNGVIGAFRDTMSAISEDGAVKDESPKMPPLEQERPAERSASSGYAPFTRQSSPQAPVQPGMPLVVSFNGHQVVVSATLDTGDSIEQLIRVLEANKPLLPQSKNGAESKEKGEGES